MSREARQRSLWGLSSQARSRRASGHRALGVAEHGEQAAAALAVRTRPGLRLARRAVVRRVARRPPRAGVGDRARVARRPGRRAHQRAQLHQRDRPGGGVGLVLGEQALGEALLAGRRGDRRELDAADEAGQHPADVGVEHGVPLAEAERRDRRGRVVAHAGERAQVVVRRGHPAVVPLDDRGGRGVQPQRAARVAEPAPRADGLAARRGGEVRGRRPGLEPLAVHRLDAGDRGLLEHELRDHHRPRRRLLAAPGQLAGMGVVPVQQRRYQGIHRWRS